MSSQYLTINPDTMPGDGDTSYVLKASSVYGGVTIISAVATTSAAGTLNLQLLNYGTGGTAVAGTIAEFASGTATVLAADTPQAFTLTATQVFVDEGEYVVLKKVEAAAGNDLSADASILIEYVPGVVTQG